MWDKIKELIGDSAPIVGGLLGGPAGAAVGGLLSKALGVENSASAIEAELVNNPEALVKLRELEMSKEIAVLKSQYDNKVEDNRHEEHSVNLEVNDKQNARELQVEALKQDDLFSKRFVYYFASFWSIIASIYIIAVTFITIPAANIRFVDTVIGFMLGTIVSTIIGYFFGSSLKKDK